jgi:hypothetical protein
MANTNNTQTYRAVVTFEWSSEVFEGDPDDVFELAEAEKKYLEGICASAADALSVDYGVYTVNSIEPVLGDK